MHKVLKQNGIVTNVTLLVIIEKNNWKGYVPSKNSVAILNTMLPGGQSIPKECPLIGKKNK